MTNTLSILKSLFQDATCYMATIPTYAGGPMAFGWASDEKAHLEVALETLEKRYADAGIETRYSNPEVHKAAFALPNYIKELL